MSKFPVLNSQEALPSTEEKVLQAKGRKGKFQNDSLSGSAPGCIFFLTRTNVIKLLS